jgi:hypothetical protein
MSDFLAAKVFTVVDISIQLPVFGSFCYFTSSGLTSFQLVEFTLLLYKSSSSTEEKKRFHSSLLHFRTHKYLLVFSLYLPSQAATALQLPPYDVRSL